MKKIVLTILAILSINIASAQFKLGVKAGVSANMSSLKIAEFDSSELINAFQDGRNEGFHIGLQFRAQTGIGLYIAADALYNYTPEKIGIIENNEMTSLSVSTYGIEIPVVVGFKIAFLRAYAGPTFYASLGKSVKSEGSQNLNVSASFDNNVLGYQFGVGIDLLDKITVDVNYNGRFAKSGQVYTVADAAGAILGKMNAEMASKQVWITVGFLF